MDRQAERATPPEPLGSTLEDMATALEPEEGLARTGARPGSTQPRRRTT